MKNVEHWRGLVALVGDAVEHGATAVKDVHLATARRTFSVLEAIPGLAPPSRMVHRIFDLSVSATYGSVRVAARGAVGLMDAVLVHLDGR